MKKGNCIQVACDNIIENKTENLMFCYAYVYSDTHKKRILHAWNELQDVVFDFSNEHQIVMRKEKYYELGKIKEKDVTKTNREETFRLMIKTKSYGGWII